MSIRQITRRVQGLHTAPAGPLTVMLMVGVLLAGLVWMHVVGHHSPSTAVTSAPATDSAVMVGASSSPTAHHGGHGAASIGDPVAACATCGDPSSMATTLLCVLALLMFTALLGAPRLLARGTMRLPQRQPIPRWLLLPIPQAPSRLLLCISRT
ncbi:hypothetical protein [Jonesia quinghaiensis]|uniref:hypothetical protein n=1 Tax=Jonesia quinghaiensis TaxID=262806 RepID=UPI0012F9113F|nr:hypothetical protein [Jonesia quinghaiensis]